MIDVLDRSGQYELRRDGKRLRLYHGDYEINTEDSQDAAEQFNALSVAARRACEDALYGVIENVTGQPVGKTRNALGQRYGGKHGFSIHKS